MATAVEERLALFRIRIVMEALDGGTARSGVLVPVTNLGGVVIRQFNLKEEHGWFKTFISHYRTL